MMPFFFGTRERRLFGAYDPARTTKRAARAALICAPWGNEYIYSHRTLRQLALRLSQNGFHVLRFDYYATGDSAGADGENDTAGSGADVETAWAELKEITGIARISLVGLRFGASLAADVVARRASEVEALVLWEPLTALEDEAAGPAESPADFRALDLDERAPSLPARSLVLSTVAPKRHASRQLAVDFVACEPPWVEQNVQTGVIPVKAVRHIVNWLG
ncbi:MAG: alpha/beta hydrolase [Hyphomicrobiaceae bacterium]